MKTIGTLSASSQKNACGVIIEVSTWGSQQNCCEGVALARTTTLLHTGRRLRWTDALCERLGPCVVVDLAWLLLGLRKRVIAGWFETQS